uniref:CaM_binding domain-containing protein n=1 Tax=Heterorhabditis bacteriophora TaxID=37862 RepID=A0A1I7WSZ7_HETBA
METTNESVTKLSRSLKKSLEATTPLSIIKKSVVSPNSSFTQKSKPFLVESSATTPKRLSPEKASHIHVEDTLQCDSFMTNSMSSATLKTSTRVRMVGTPRDSSLSIPNNGAKTPTLRRKDNLRVSSTSKSITKDKSTTHRFAKKHAKLFAEMESLDDHKIKIERRHQNNMRAATDFVKVSALIFQMFLFDRCIINLKRLATPKALIGRKRTTNFTSETRTSGSVIHIVFHYFKTTYLFVLTNKHQYVPHTPVTKQENVKAVKGNNQRDVKSRTKNTGKPMRSLLSNSTAPLDKNFLSTPVKVPGKSSYTPHRGVVGNYIDTTKLTDREFELAVKSGIIKGKNTRKSSIQVTQILRTKRRDEILDLKRKLNVKNN